MFWKVVVVTGTAGSPWDGGGRELACVDSGTVTVTLKQGAKSDAAWIVVKAPSSDAAKRLLCESFGYDPGGAGVAGFTLAELVATFSRSFQGVRDVQDVLGGRVVDPSSGVAAGFGSAPEDTVSASSDSVGLSDVWEGKPDNVLAIYAMILASPSATHLQSVVWKQYYSTISGDPDLMALFKEQAEALKAADKAAGEGLVQGALV